LRKGEYSEASDLFSFGALVYEAVCGQRAFPGTEAMVVAHQVMDAEPLAPSEANRAAAIPAKVDTAILRALRKNPADRWASPRTFASALRQAYDGRAMHGTSRRRISLPFVMTLMVGVVAALWVVAQNCQTAGMKALELGGGADAGIDAGTVADAGAVADGGTGADAGAGPSSDAGAIVLSPHEREEAAKDQLARAREALQARDFEGAASALARARQFDPQNPDIAELEARLPREPSDGAQ
jgi:hypothetical protein